MSGQSFVIRAPRGASPVSLYPDCGSGFMSCSNLSWNTTDDTLREVSVVFLLTRRLRLHVASCLERLTHTNR